MSNGVLCHVYNVSSNLSLTDLDLRMGIIFSCLTCIVGCIGECIMGIISCIVDCLECIIGGTRIIHILSCRHKKFFFLTKCV
jgi:hypothetical protein